MTASYTRVEIEAAMKQLGWHISDYAPVLTSDLNALVGACKTRMVFRRHISERGGVKGTFMPTIHEQATLTCLEDVVQRLCKETRLANHEAMNLLHQLSR